MADGKSFLSQENKEALRNPWVWGWLALVVVVLAVNIGMIATAIVTNPGLVDKDYYEKGREYERTVMRRAASRTELGWELGIELPQQIVVGRQAVVRFTAADKQGQPISGAQVTVVAYRPSDAGADFAIPMKEIVPGQYDGYTAFTLKGTWELQAQVVKGEGDFTITRRISVLSE